MTIADRIRIQREKLGLSQADLAKRMGLKSRSSITRIERSGDDVSMRDIERLAYYLDCSKLYLMGWAFENSDTDKDDEQFERFKKYYYMLNADQKKLIDNMLIALSSKQ